MSKSLLLASGVYVKMEHKASMSSF